MLLANRDVPNRESVYELSGAIGVLHRVYKLTEGEFLAGIGRQGEPEDGHAGNQDARHDQVEEVVECASSDDDDKSDVYVRFWAAVVVDLISLTGYPWAR